MPPQLTEAWATTYLSAVITLFVFALGVPAIIYHIGIPEDVLQVIYRNRWIKRWILILMVLPYAISASALIWFLHPSSSTTTPNTLEYWTGGVISFLIIFSFTPWFYVWRITSRSKVLKRLANEAINSQYHGKIGYESKLDDLCYLGTSAITTETRKSVLEIYAQIAPKVQTSSNYGGSELMHFTSALEGILVYGEKRGSDDEFRIAANILERILYGLWDQGLYGSQDEYSVIKALNRLAIIAIIEKSRSTALVYLQTVSQSSTSLFYLAEAAINEREYYIAILALSKVESIINLERPVKRESIASYFGILAHFFGHKNMEIKLFAEDSLSREYVNFDVPLIKSYETALQYFRNIQYFDTVSKLSTIRHRVLNYSS